MTSKIDPTVQHPQYAELARKFELVTDAFEGCVQEYVHRLSGMTDAKFNEYVARAAYFGVVQPTTSALIGAMTRKPFTLDGMAEFPRTEYKSPDVFLQSLIRDELHGARVGILVDVDEDGKSKLVNYDADDIINWSDRFIMIKECRMEPDAENPYAHVAVHTWRELTYDESGNYLARRWSKDKKGQFQVEELPQLLVNGAPIDFIPLFIATPYDNSWDVYTPPLFVQAGLNIQHFKQAVDLAHYARHMSLPTFTITGDLQEYESGEGNWVKAEVKLGSTEHALHLKEGSDAKYVEVSGASFSMLQAELTKIEERMMQSGARLMTSKKGVESAEAMQIRAGGEQAILETITNGLESALNQALALCALIDRTGTAPVLTLNKDFQADMLDAAHVKTLLDLYVAGAITIEELSKQLYDNEIISDPNAV